MGEQLVAAHKNSSGVRGGAAIPTCFPEHSTGDRGMIDDGVVANAPDLIFVAKAMTMRQPDATAQACDHGHPAASQQSLIRCGEIHAATKGWMNDRRVLGLGRT